MKEHDRRMCGNHIHTDKRCVRCNTPMTDFEYNVVNICNTCIEKSDPEDTNLFWKNYTKKRDECMNWTKRMVQYYGVFMAVLGFIMGMGLMYIILS